ncbi:MAG: hypothetical protein QOH88_359 [Verrucomicrobiota bacterium]|jgi:hypothetical protein
MDRILHEATLVCFDSGSVRPAYRRDGRADAYPLPLAHAIEESRSVAFPKEHAHTQGFSDSEGFPDPKTAANAQGFADAQDLTDSHSDTVAKSLGHAEAFPDAETFANAKTPQAHADTETDSGDEARRRARHRGG